MYHIKCGLRTLKLEDELLKQGSVINQCVRYCPLAHNEMFHFLRILCFYHLYNRSYVAKNYISHIPLQLVFCKR